MDINKIQKDAFNLSLFAPQAQQPREQLQSRYTHPFNQSPSVAAEDHPRKYWNDRTS